MLINLDPFQIYDELDEYTLLCYEDNNEFCHRHIVACWLEDTLGIITPEIKFVDGKITRVQRPKYIKELYKESKHILKR